MNEMTISPIPHFNFKLLKRYNNNHHHHKAGNIYREDGCIQIRGAISQISVIKIVIIRIINSIIDNII